MLANARDMAFGSDILLDELQSTLAALADIDVRYEIKRRNLDRWSGPDTIKRRLADQLEARHRREREPYVLRLRERYRRMMALTLHRVESTRLTAN